jgi:protein O-GlcNAc transferase
MLTAVLTCPGDTFAGRVAASLLHAIGMDELVANSLEDYERIALALIGNPARLQAIRREIEHKRDANALFDLSGLTRSVEAAYDRMWQYWLAGAMPQAFAIGNG